MRVTAYKCEETGQLFESKQKFLEHKDDLKKQTEATRKLALEDDQIRAICEAPRLHATGIPHLESLLLAALNALSAYPRLRILKTIAVDLTAALEPRRWDHATMSERSPENSDATPPSEMEFHGVLKVFQIASPPGGKHPIETMFPYLNRTDGGGTRHSNGQWVETWGVTLCVDDFPLLRKSTERLLELRALRNQRLTTLSQQLPLLEEENVVLHSVTAECDQVIEQIRVLEERLRVLRDQQQAIREEISQELQARFPDGHQEERQNLEIAIPMGRAYRS